MPDQADRGEKGGGAKFLVIFLIIVLLGMGAYALFTQVLGDKSRGDQQGRSGATAMGPDVAMADAEAARPMAVDAAVSPMRVEPAMQPPPECTDGVLTAVSTTPQGGKIFLNEKDTGQVTPGQICIPKNRKKKVIRVELDMYRPGYLYFRSVKDAKLDTILLKPITYRIVIKTYPKRAKVHLNDKYVGQTTLSFKIQPSDKVMKLKISKVNFESKEITLDRTTLKWSKQSRYSFIFAVALRLRRIYTPSGGAMDRASSDPMREDPEPRRVDPMREDPEPRRVEPDPMRVEPMRVEPRRVEPRRVEPRRARPMRPRAADLPD